MSTGTITAEVDPLVLLAAANAAYARYKEALAIEEANVQQARAEALTKIMEERYWFFWPMTAARAVRVYNHRDSWRWGHYVGNHFERNIKRCAEIATIAGREALHAIRLSEADIALLGENLSTGEIAG